MAFAATTVQTRTAKECYMNIGSVGLGPMGSRMAARLLAAGHAVTVWNRTGGKAGDLLAAGAVEAASPADAARGAELVMSMVADDEALEAVTLGGDGIASGLGAGGLHVSSSTISVALAKRLAAVHAGRGQGFISATVLGRPPAAAEGKLFVMAAGDASAIARAMPVFDAIGQRVFVVGDEAWTSNLVKLCANFMIFSTIEQFAEVFALGSKAGVAEETIFEVLSNSFCSAPVHKNYGRIILDRAFSPPGGPMVLGKKDNDLLLEAGEEFGAALPMASLLRDRFVTALACGDGALDFAALSRRARADAGLD